MKRGSANTGIPLLMALVTSVDTRRLKQRHVRSRDEKPLRNRDGYGAHPMNRSDILQQGGCRTYGLV